MSSYWCATCGQEGQNPICKGRRTRSFSFDGGDLGTGMIGNLYVYGPIDWRDWPELRCRCRLAHEEQQARFFNAAKAGRWEACAGRSSVSLYAGPDPDDIYEEMYE